MIKINGDLEFNVFILPVQDPDLQVGLLVSPIVVL
jgi:hypothetical protein